MQIVLHVGAHFTEEDRLMKCLLRNKEDFAKRGIAVPGPGRYRKLLREMFTALQAAPPSAEARDVLMDAFLDDQTAERVLLSHANIFGAPRACLRDGRFFSMAHDRLQALAHIFEHDQLEIFLAIRDPSTFLPLIFDASPQETLPEFLRGAEPTTIKWSETIQMMRDAAPNAAITVWCNEDSPLIWAQIIRDMAGLEHGEKIVGGFDLLSQIMTQEGMQRFRSYLSSHPTMSEMQKRRVIAAFLDKFALDDAIEEELDLPGWTDELVDTLGDIYDQDVYEISRIPGVTLIAP